MTACAVQLGGQRGRSGDGLRGHTSVNPPFISRHAPAAWLSFWLLSAPAHLRACGAAALKTDFTRTGKRTVAGVVGDAWHSTQRYFLANFVDAWRQDCLELFLSNYRVQRCHALGTDQPSFLLTCCAASACQADLDGDGPRGAAAADDGSGAGGGGKAGGTLSSAFAHALATHCCRLHDGARLRVSGGYRIAWQLKVFAVFIAFSLGCAASAPLAPLVI